MKPQCTELLDALRQRPMTTGQIRALGIGMPATRVFELRQEGYDISTESVKVRTRRGKPAHVAKYTLNEATAQKKAAA